MADAAHTYYVVNPGGDLRNTEKAFATSLLQEYAMCLIVLFSCVTVLLWTTDNLGTELLVPLLYTLLLW